MFNQPGPKHPERPPQDNTESEIIPPTLDKWDTLLCLPFHSSDFNCLFYIGEATPKIRAQRCYILLYVCLKILHHLIHTRYLYSKYCPHFSDEKIGEKQLNKLKVIPSVSTKTQTQICLIQSSCSWILCQLFLIFHFLAELNRYTV